MTGSGGTPRRHADSPGFSPTISDGAGEEVEEEEEAGGAIQQLLFLQGRVGPFGFIESC